MIAGEAQQGIEPFRNQRRLPVSNIVRVEIAWSRPAVARCQVFKQFDTWTLWRPKRGDPEPGAEHIVQMFLFDVIVFALAGDLHSERVPVEM